MVVIDMKYGIKKTVGGKGRTYCVCKCDCGNTSEILMDNIRSGRAKSCGCDAMERRIKAIRKDLTGEKFSRLTVLEMMWEERPTKCRCMCECGNEVIVAGADLSSGHTQSCGCLQRERTSEANEKDWSGYINSRGIRFIRQSKMNKAGQWLWICECPICHKEFEALPAKLNNARQASCGCGIKSSGEIFVESILNSLKVSYDKQYAFDDCFYKGKLRFDFAIHVNEQKPILIEYDGQQHYKPIDYFGGDIGYKETVIRDRLKDNYCKEKDITLLRLPYYLSDEEIKEKIINVLNPERLRGLHGNMQAEATPLPVA